MAKKSKPKQQAKCLEKLNVDHYDRYSRSLGLPSIGQKNVNILNKLNESCNSHFINLIKQDYSNEVKCLEAFYILWAKRRRANAKES